MVVIGRAYYAASVGSAASFYTTRKFGVSTISETPMRHEVEKSQYQVFKIAER